MALLPRRKWTNQLAWSVWAQRRNNKLRQSRFPMGRLPSVSSTYYPEPVGGSEGTEKYLTTLDGLSGVWLRGEPFDISVGDHEISFEFFVPSAWTGTQIIASASMPLRTIVSWNSAGALAFTYSNGGGGSVFLNTSSENIFVVPNAINKGTMLLSGGLLTMILNGQAATPVAYTFIDTEAVDWLGARESGGDYTETAITAVSLDGLITRFSGNASTEMPIGVELPSLSDFTLQGDSVRELVTRKSDNSGWLGDGTEYNYALGSITA